MGMTKSAIALAFAAFWLVAENAWAATTDQFSLQRAEFAKYHRQITGKDAPDGAVRFAIDPKVSKSGNDAYRIASEGSGVAITGANLRCVWYGLYDLLERRGGCCWFWDGDVVPQKDTIDLSGLDVIEESRFEYRAIRYFAHRGLTRFQAEHWGRKEWVREIDWCLKSRLNCIMPRVGMDDTWQKAFPDIVGYPEPDDPADDNLGGFNNRAPFWDLRHRGELRRFFTKYAFDRGLMIPTDFGTMTHWYARTPVSFLEAKNPPFLPQANKTYKERTGLVWDVFQGEWADDYIRLTEAFIDAGYGSPDLLHTIGLGERMCYTDRAKNLELKKKVLALMTEKALAKYPGSKILLAGWDFYNTWEPDEVKELVAELDPTRTVFWDYEGEASRHIDSNGCRAGQNDFTKWGLVGKFPYTFGIFLAYENALDIRAHYGLIEEREKIAAADPFCKGYLFWPESSHTDTFLLEYFTANAWRPGHGHEALLPVFCRDRYGEKAEAFEPIWRRALPVSQLLGWWGNCGQELFSWGPAGWPCRQRASLDEDGEILSAAPGILSDLAAISPEDDFQRRDVVDLARTVVDRLAIWIHQRMFGAFFAWCNGAGSEDDIRFWCARYLEAMEAEAEILSLHTDFSLCESIDRLAEEAPVFGRDFGKVLLDNASNKYCRSHQYEIAAGWYLPYARDLVREVLRRVGVGQRVRIPDEWADKARQSRLDNLVAKGIVAFRPPSSRTADDYRRVLTSARDVSARVFKSIPVEAAGTGPAKR